MTLTQHIGEDGKIIAPNIGREGAVPVIVPLPSIAEMSAMSDEALLGVLQRFGAAGTWDQWRVGTADLVSKVMAIPPGTGAFQARLDELVFASNHTTLVGLTRRTQEQWTTMDAIAGDMTAELIRISEGDDHVCERCAELAGATGTYEEHMTLGLPGSQSCDGGERCRCQLVRFG